MPVPIPIDGGGGGGVSTPTATIYHAPENSMMDTLSSYGIGQNEYVLNDMENINSINYVVNTINGVVQSPEKKIGPNTGFGTQSSYIPFANNSWSYVSGGSTSVRFQRPFAGPGLQKDKIYWNGSLKATYDYIILQKSVVGAIYSTLVLGVVDEVYILAPSQINTVDVNVDFQLDKSTSRGKEVSSTWSIFKTDPLGTFLSIPAVDGVDYSLSTGTLTSDIIRLQFLTNYNFEVRLNVSGYTYASNPYLNYPAQTVPNSAAATYYFNTTTAPAPTVTYEIKVPKITPELSVPNAVLIGTNPFETYQNQLITVSSVLDIPSGYWKKTEGLTITYLTKSDSEWRDEINTNCNVVLEARDKITNELVLTRNGLGPFTLSFNIVSNYNLQFITTL